MNTQEFTHLDGKLTDIARLIGDTRSEVAVLRERSVTKDEAHELQASFSLLSSRIHRVESSLKTVADFQKTCPAVAEMNYEERRKKEISQSRKALFAAFSSLVAFVTAVVALWQTIFASPSSAKQTQNPPPPAIIQPLPHQPRIPSWPLPSP